MEPVFVAGKSTPLPPGSFVLARHYATGLGITSGDSSISVLGNPGWFSASTIRQSWLEQRVSAAMC